MLRNHIEKQQEQDQESDQEKGVNRQGPQIYMNSINQPTGFFQFTSAFLRIKASH